jgi:hypothetical protein
MQTTLLRASGLTLMVSTLLLGVGIALVTNAGYVTPWRVMLFLGALLLSLSLPGMYAFHARAAGWLGLAGHVLLSAGILLVLFFGAAPLLLPGFTGFGESVTAFTLGNSAIVGFLLTAIAMLRARVYPRWAGILMLVTGGLFFFSFIVAELLPPLAGKIGNALLGLLLLGTFSWIGLTLLRAKTTA